MSKSEVIRLHIGGDQVREGWKIYNAQKLPGVDYVGNCTDLSQFPDESVTEIYASHVYEHLSYQGELQKAMREANRVLKPGGLFRLGVPDLEVLCKLMLNPQIDPRSKHFVMRMIMGGQVDPWDFHKTGFTADILAALLHQFGFTHIRRVPDFGLFRDTTTLRYLGVPISLNVQCIKSGPPLEEPPPPL